MPWAASSIAVAPCQLWRLARRKNRTRTRLRGSLRPPPPPQQWPDLSLARAAGEPSPTGHRSPFPERRARLPRAGHRRHLDGGLDDGSAGLFAIKNRGGIAIVQDPREALDAGMPRSALRNVDVDHCVPLAEMPALLGKLTHSRIRLLQKNGKEKETSGTSARRKSRAFVTMRCRSSARNATDLFMRPERANSSSSIARSATAFLLKV